ncbi:MAG: hypothetical protein ACJ74H_18335 [Thermoanaerobaculia bacterium]
MTEQPTPEPEHEPDAGPAMPRWVPILIGIVLVTMAALAVYTGLRYRDDTLTAHIKPQRVQRAASAPPGEPEAGASLVGTDTPSANEPVAGSARAVISGGPGGVQSTVRIWARRGMLLEVTPPDSMIYVNDTVVGHANQFDTEDEIYEFPAPGSYTVRVVAPSNQQKTYIVTAADDAKQDVARIKAAL